MKTLRSHLVRSIALGLLSAAGTLPNAQLGSVPMPRTS